MPFLAVAGGLALSVSGCAAQTADAPSSTKALTDKFHITTTPPEPQEFVRKSRPATMDYRPVGVVPPSRSIKPKSPDELKKMEADLVGTRARHDKISGRPPPEVAKAKAEREKAAKAKGAKGRTNDKGGGNAAKPAG